MCVCVCCIYLAPFEMTFQYRNLKRQTRSRSSSSSLLTLRSIQSWSWCFLGLPCHRKNVLCLHLLTSLIGITCLVLFKFYFLETYHIYGCRKKLGYYSLPCPEWRRPKGSADISSILVLLMGSLCILFGRTISFIAMRSHWKCWIAKEIRANVNVQVPSKQQDAVCKVICALENVPFRCHFLNCPYRNTGNHDDAFFRHLSSCIFSEIFLAWHFKRWQWFTILLLGLLGTLTIPITLFASGGSTSTLEFAMALCMLLYYAMPLFSFFMMLTCIPLLLSHADAVSKMTLVTFGFWFTLLTLCLFVSNAKEKYDEVHLVKEHYLGLLGQSDGSLAMKLNGYGK